MSSPATTIDDLDSLQLETISETGLARSSARLLPPNTVSYSTRATIGKIGISSSQITTNQGFTNFICDETKITPRYLAYALIHETPRIALLGGNTTFLEISKTAIRKYKIPLPATLSEQHRIVEILDQADALRQQRRQANQLSQKIIPALFQEMFGDKEFPSYPIGELALDERGSIRTGPFGSQLLHSEFTEEGEVAVLGIDNVVTNKFRWNKPRFISGDRYEELRRYTVRPGDLLVTIMGTCGRCAVAPADIPTSINTKHLCCITLDRSKCLPEFLHATFLFDHMLRNHLGAREKGAVMPGLNMGVIKSVPVRVPPIDLQHGFARAVKKLDEPIEASTTSTTTLETLFQTLLHRAFDGSLTAKWREAHAAELLQEMESQT